MFSEEYGVNGMQCLSDKHLVWDQFRAVTYWVFSSCHLSDTDVTVDLNKLNIKK